MRATVLFAALLLTGCVVHRLSTAMEPWVGQDESHLVSSWGAPDRTAPLSDGSKVLTWIKPINSAEKGAPVEMTECRLSFTIGPVGKVTRWASSGCPSHYMGGVKAP